MTLKKKMKSGKKGIFIAGLTVFLLLIIYSIVVKKIDYINDSIFFIVLISIAYYYYEKLKLTKTTFMLLIIALALHNFGVFGWYGQTPIIIQYDHVTHFIGMLAVAAMIYNILSFKFPKPSTKAVVIVTILATMGVGAFIEQIEFLGFLSFGEGDGLFYFGGAGDVGVGGFGQLELPNFDAIGGGYINTLWDLTYNFLGAIAGTFLSKKRAQPKK